MDGETTHNAGGSMAGYLFQCRLALLLCLKLVKKQANGHIFIEKFDDIAFEDDDYAKCLVQAKHSIEPKSLDDKSVDLWKALKVWMDQFAAGIITFSSNRFVLITTAVASTGSAAGLLRVGATKEDRAGALVALRKAAKESKNKTTQSSRDAFLDLSDEQAETLLAQIEVIDGHSNLANVVSEVEGELVLLAPSDPQLAASYLEGWWLNVIGKCLISQSHASIPLQHVVMKANEIGKVLSGQTLPINDPTELGVKGYSDDDEDQIFVRQMRVVGMPDRVVRRGVEDFYRALAQRSRWARENLLLDEELGKYDAGLEDRWGRQFDAEVTMSEKNSEVGKEECGQKVCLWATQQSFPLRDVVETWITAGSFHGLSERLKVGWHPDFETMFGETTANEGS